MSTVPPGSQLRSAPSVERRRNPRCRIIDGKIVPVDLGRDRHGLLVDLSVTGASVHPYGILHPGETSAMEFRLPDSGTLFQAVGSVAWINASGRVGIEFMKMPAPARVSLDQWIASVAAASSGLPTKAEPQVAAAYLPSSYSPWINVNDTVRSSVQQEFSQELSGLDLVSALRLLLDRARSLTRATGAAIALADGSEIVCRARCGVAPDLGARFKPDNGLSGEAVRTGKTVLCSDTAQDARVDRAACERLNLRSVLIEPILNGNSVIGVIETFSPEPNSFDQNDLAHLKRLSEMITAMLETNFETPRGRRIQ